MARAWLFENVHYTGSQEPAELDPRLARQIYGDHFVEWERADELGFDGLFLGEHHFTPYAITPSPNLLLAALARRTERLRLGVMAHVLPFHQPVRLAAECAMLDLITDGRLDVGFARGVNDKGEFERFGQSYDDARGRFEDAVELIGKAWTDPVAGHDGPFFSLPSAPVYPRPLQQPHPPVWIAAFGPETAQWAASMGYGVTTILLPTERIRENLDRFREAAIGSGHPDLTGRTGLTRHIVVADTTDEAIALARPNLQVFFSLLKGHEVPPSLDDLPDDREIYRAIFSRVTSEQVTFDDLLDLGIVIAGDPDTVRDRVLDQIAVTGASDLLGIMHFGHLTRDQAMRSEQLLAEHVLPELREVEPLQAAAAPPASA